MLRRLQPYDMPLLRDCDNLLQDSPRIVLMMVTSGLGDSVALKPARRMIQLDGRGLLLLSTRLMVSNGQQIPSQRTRLVLMLSESNPRSMMLASMILMPVTCQWMHFLTIWLLGVNMSVLTAISMQMVDFRVQTTPKSMMLIMGVESVDASQIRCITIFGPISAQPMFFLCFFPNVTN
ncbi:uncharacterized protein BJ212DRAFT_1373020 [Suillus subaureus]|uniref:Uncharacterized protein n=1 Tax=Suillus subaureus TaxID=48587 RepID=A0A9P7JAT6_9AGAM|nr:uncharacterized protein BJ212DRAFT_1373020 [Suillus subaureus]KAG1811772.1 hypothetical protein BJ212DRAFT_1373020 [Suillus subaureus]